MPRSVRQSGSIAPGLILRLALGALSAAACASESQQCGLTPCSPGSIVSEYCACDGYYGTQVCENDQSVPLCTIACSGGACCDPGFAPTQVTAGSNYAGCRPGPKGLSDTLCCPSADADAENGCPAACSGAFDCTGNQICCSASTPAGSACLDSCGFAAQICVTTSECSSNWICDQRQGTCQPPPLLPCGSTGDCAVGGVCCSDESSAFTGCQAPPVRPESNSFAPSRQSARPGRHASPVHLVAQRHARGLTLPSAIPRRATSSSRTARPHWTSARRLTPTEMLQRTAMRPSTRRALSPAPSR